MVLDVELGGLYFWNLPYLKNPHHQSIISYKNNVFTIDSMKLYDYNPSNGLLKISIPQSGLESMISEIGYIPKEGKNVSLNLPPDTGHNYVTFQNVKRVERMDEFFDGKYLLRYVSMKDGSKGVDVDLGTEAESLAKSMQSPEHNN